MCPQVYANPLQTEVGIREFVNSCQQRSRGVEGVGCVCMGGGDVRGGKGGRGGGGIGTWEPDEKGVRAFVVE